MSSYLAMKLKPPRLEKLNLEAIAKFLKAYLE
jgi:hypothetical protein